MKHPADFWKRVRVSNRPTRCWPWKGKLNKYGYPQLNYRGKQWRGNRLAFTLVKGPIPRGKQALHDCRPQPDNRACCNPSHLYAGTPHQNWHDGVGRGKNKFKLAEKNWGGKLTDAEVEWAVAQRGKLRQIEIASRLNCSRSHVANIHRGARRKRETNPKPMKLSPRPT